MIRVRVQQIEQAIAEGRLDEACFLMRGQDLRDSDRGRQAVAVLVAMLVERARIHLAAGRLPEAKADADRALAFAGNQADVAQLREAIANAFESDARRKRKRAEQLAAARQQIDRGRLALGEKWLRDVSAVESRAANLLREIDVKKSMLESALAAASAAMDRQDLGAAAREVKLAREADSTDARVVELASKLTSAINVKLHEAINSGRLDLADTLTQQLATVSGETTEVQQYRRGIEQCRQAWSFLESGEPARAGEILKRLEVIFPSAPWIQETLSHVRQAEAALGELRSGPLAMLSSAEVTERQKPRTPGREARVTGGAIPVKFMLRVDGAGSFCVFRKATVSIGPISSSQQPDLGLLAEPGVPVATIERREDEYFVRGAAVAVNDRPGTGKLLASGDRIALSPRCRMSFSLPSPASTTAVLDLTGCRYPRADVRRVILFDGDIILGPGMATHVRVDDAEENVILHIRDGRLYCEAKVPVEVNGEPLDRVAGIPMEANVRIGQLSLVISHLG
jgi:hypothetical protein